uniref:C-type lectin domain-containing protein n=1 Tax=Macrostomum lignano TaxID=282301 RepID=A0A1I8JAY2_9PLAT
MRSATLHLLGICLAIWTLPLGCQARYFCPTPWTQYFDRCIRLFTTTYTQSTAATYCASLSNGAGRTGALYAPRARQDLAVFDHLEWLNYELWVGATRNATLGKFVDSEGNLIPDDLFYLGLTEANGLDCAHYSLDLGRLSLRSCSVALYFICQVPASTPSSYCSPSFLTTSINIDIHGDDDLDMQSTGMNSYFSLYYFYPLQYSSKDDERIPLLFGIPGRLNVSFSASSFINYARPEYVLINNNFRTGSHRVCKWYREYYGDLDVNQNGEACIPYSAWPATTNKCRT